MGDGALLLTFKANYRENSAVAATPGGGGGPKYEMPGEQNERAAFFAPLLSSCPTHLTRSSPTMNDGVNCINFPLQKSALDSAPLSGLLLARRSNFASKAETRSAVSASNENVPRLLILCIPNASSSSALSGKVKH